jgi:hypothetical protein
MDFFAFRAASSGFMGSVRKDPEKNKWNSVKKEEFLMGRNSFNQL